MFKRFYPDTEVDSVSGIPYEDLYAGGVRGVIFDIDNTLVPHNAPASDKTVEFFKKLHQIGLKTIVLSNNKEPRVKSFCENLDTEYIFKANKPGTAGYQKAMEKMDTDVTNTVFIGDQLFTDVWGAKKTGIRTYLVKPIHPREEIQIVLKRQLERIVLFFYHRSLKRDTNSKKHAAEE